MTNPSPQTRDHSANSGAAHESDAIRLLGARRASAAAEGRRVLMGSLALIVLAVVVANVVIERGAQSKLRRQGWDRLTAGTESKRDQIRTVLGSVVREARSVAEDPVVRHLAERVSQGSASDAERAQLLATFERSEQLLGFDAVQVHGPDGTLRLGTNRSVNGRESREIMLARNALKLGRPLVGDPFGVWLAVAVPIQDRKAPDTVLLFHLNGERVLYPVLNEWTAFSEPAEAYLVRAEGGAVLRLTRSPVFPDPGDARLAFDDPRAFASAMAATGVESRATGAGPGGRSLWAVTRALPEFGWGIVGRADADAMMAPLRSTLVSLVLFDVGCLAFIAGLLWFWRRHFRGRIEAHERDLLARHAQRVQAILDTAFDAIVTFDGMGRVRSANHGAAILFGRPIDELERTSIHDLLHWDTPAGRALPRPGTTTRAEVPRLNGEHIPVEFSLGSVDADGEVQHTAIVRDIRDRIESELRVRAFAQGLEVTNRRLEEANAQLEEASRLKTEFLANTSHELRTPLNGMIGFVQLVLDDMCESRDEERDFLRQALQCSRHLLGLINDVLDIAKIEAGKLALQIEPLDLQALFDEVYTLTHVQAAQRGLKLRFDHQLPAGTRVRGDFAKVKQVLVNLVGNSLKFTHEGGIVVRARSRDELGHVLIEVEDTGIGIPRDRQTVVFEKFVQADGSTTRRYGGTGLGLAITKSLVELMGGIIGVHSEGEGRGTRMYFSLPIWRDAVEPVPAAVSERAHTAAARGAEGPLVVVVEDDPVFRRFVVAVLERHGFRWAEADSAESGWRLVRRVQPDIVVLDYALTCGDNASLRTGWDLAEQMTLDPATRHIPLVFVTGFDREVVERIRATTFGRRPEHLQKPVDARALIARLEALVGDVQDRPLRVLAADDDPTVHAYLRKALPLARFELESVADGEECLHVLRTDPAMWDVLLLDLMMPGMNGYDVLREITLTSLRPDLPVVVMTNFPEPRTDAETRLLQRGLVLDVVSKGDIHSEPRLLAEVLDRHLHRAPPAVPGDREAA